MKPPCKTCRHECHCCCQPRRYSPRIDAYKKNPQKKIFSRQTSIRPRLRLSINTIDSRKGGSVSHKSSAVRQKQCSSITARLLGFSWGSRSQSPLNPQRKSQDPKESFCVTLIVRTPSFHGSNRSVIKTHGARTTFHHDVSFVQIEFDSPGYRLLSLPNE